MKSSANTFLYSFLTLLAIIGCDYKPQPAEKVKAFAEEVERRKIKKVSKIQLVDKAKILSQEIISRASLANMDSIAREENCVLEKIVLTQRSFPDSISGQLAEAYLYSIEKGISPEAISQFSPDEDYLIYTKPFQETLEDSTRLGFWYVKFPKKEIILRL